MAKTFQGWQHWEEKGEEAVRRNSPSAGNGTDGMKEDNGVNKPKTEHAIYGDESRKERNSEERIMGRKVISKEEGKTS